LPGLSAITLAVMWYGLAIATHPMEQVAGSHRQLLFSEVVPGLAIGYLLAFSLSGARAAYGNGRIAELGRSLRLVLGVNAAFALIALAYLIGNVRDDILLVAADVLLGAEHYQLLGDALTTNLLVGVLVLRASDAAETSGRVLYLLFEVVMGAVYILAGVLLGSNKLLLIAALLLGIATWTGVRATFRRHPAVSVVSALGIFVGLLLGYSALSDSIWGVVAQTRLLDYGNVTSLLETPSIAGRIGILAECGHQQLARAPFFGDLAAEYYSCGEGEYLHSILSVQTHLGAVGSLLLGVSIIACAVWAWRYREVSGVGALFLVIVGVAALAAFFTWFPLWVMLGLGAGLPGERSAGMWRSA